MIKLSIIVPIYNTSKYLRRCIDSILAQTFTDFELILINDGSTDNSLEILRNYEVQDSRIVVIDKVNEGVAAARNQGIEIAKGEYIMFSDSDDYVDRDWIKKLYTMIKENTCGFVNCSYKKCWQDGKVNVIRLTSDSTIVTLSKDNYFCLYKNGYSHSLWNKIYSSKIIRDNSIRFDNSVYNGEDVLFNIEYFRCCDSIIYIPEALYNMNQTDGSLSRKYDPHYYDIIKRLYYPRLTVLGEKDLPLFYDESFYRFYNCIEIVNDSRNKETEKEKLDYCNYILNDEAFIDAMNHSSEAACSKKLKKVLAFKNYRVLQLFQWITGIRKD